MNYLSSLLCSRAPEVETALRGRHWQWQTRLCCLLSSRFHPRETLQPPYGIQEQPGLTQKMETSGSDNDIGSYYMHR